MRPKLADIMAVLIDALDRVLAQVGKHVVHGSDEAGVITVQACMTSASNAFSGQSAAGNWRCAR